MKIIPFSFFLIASVLLSGCGTSSVTKSAMGIQPVTSQQLVFDQITVQGDTLAASGALFSALNTLNKAKVRRRGRSMEVTMTQAMLRDGGEKRFRFSVPIGPKIDKITVGKDREVIWTRADGVLIDTSKKELRTRAASDDLENRISSILDRI